MIREAVASNRLWYHTMELAPGLVTPGWFDLRPIVDRMPWPDVAGKRCLDVGTYDGFFAFELERRGGAEVVATDIANEREWDWWPEQRDTGPAIATDTMGSEKGAGFRIAREALGSQVERVEVSVYDLDPARIGTFDVVVCGSLLLHLRDPLRALEAIRGVCTGVFLSAETVEPVLSLLHRRRPLSALRPETMQWWVPNVAGHREMLSAAGFAVVAAGRPFAIPFGPAHPEIGSGPRARVLHAIIRRLTGGFGVPTAAVLARPAR
jgi:tRNA (mo5U34)-methyltransferase